MRVWQGRGGSVHNEPIGWKLMRLDEGFSVHLLEEKSAAPRPGYKRPDPAMSGGMWGRTAAALKAERGLKKTANLRDALDTNDLVYVMAGEQLAAERIGYEDRRGVSSVASAKSASFIRQAIEADRADRRKPAP